MFRGSMVIAALLAGAGGVLAAEEFRVSGWIDSGSLVDEKAWKLDGFAVEGGKMLSRKGMTGNVGSATTTFKGSDGVYRIRIKSIHRLIVTHPGRCGSRMPKPLVFSVRPTGCRSAYRI